MQPLKFALTIFYVSVIIENKPGLADPEGETILKDLILRQNGQINKQTDTGHAIKSVRSAKLLRFEVDAEDKQQAESKVRNTCDELRIYNPVVSKITVKTNF